MMFVNKGVKCVVSSGTDRAAGGGATDCDSRRRLKVGRASSLPQRALGQAGSSSYYDVCESWLEMCGQFWDRSRGRWRSDGLRQSAAAEGRASFRLASTCSDKLEARPTMMFVNPGSECVVSSGTDRAASGGATDCDSRRRLK